MANDDSEGGLRKFYNGLEDAYYKFCDDVQLKLKIPIYDLFVTPIETKGIPSFPIFLILLLLLIGGGLFAFYTVNPGMTTAKVSVQNGGIPLANVPVEMALDGKPFKIVNTNSDGIAVFENVPIGKTATVQIIYEGYEDFSSTFTLGKATNSLTASLLNIGSKPRGTKKISVPVKIQDKDGRPLAGAYIVYYDTSDGNTKTASTDASGTAMLEASSDKSELGLTITLTGYVKTTDSIIVSVEKTKIIKMEKQAAKPVDEDGTKPPKGFVLVTVKDDLGEPVDAKVNLFLEATDEELDIGRTYDSGRVEFKNVDAVGSKVYVVAQPMNPEEFLITDASKDPQKLTSENPLEFVITLSRKVPGEDYNISLTVKEKEGEVLEGATIRWYNQETNALLTKTETDAFGISRIETDKSVYAAIYMEEYLPNLVLDMVAGDKKTIELSKAKEDNSGAVKVFVLDSYGNLQSGAKVQIQTQDGFFIGIPEEKTVEDGSATFKKVPTELNEEEASYILRASSHGASGVSSSFLIDINTQQEVTIKLSQMVGIATIKIRDATNQKEIKDGKVEAYLREDDTKIPGAECGISNGTCNIISIPANKVVYFKITSPNYLELLSEDFFLEPEQTKPYEGSLIPAALKNELFVSFDGLKSQDGEQYSASMPSLEKAAYYLAKFTLNLPAGSEKAGMVLKVSGNDGEPADKDIVEIVNYQKDSNALIRKGMTFKVSGDCKTDMAGNDGTKAVKWVNYEFSKQEGTKAVVLKIFVKPTANVKEEIAFEYSAYAGKGKIFTHSPEDLDLGMNEKTKDKDFCYGAKNKTTFTVSSDNFICKDKFCYSFLFKAGSRSGTNGFSSNSGDLFKAVFSVKTFKDMGDLGYLKITADPEIVLGDFDFLGANGRASGSEQTFQLSLADGESASGYLEMSGNIPTGYSKVNLEIGDSASKLVSKVYTITITGTNEFGMQVQPTQIEANDDKTIQVKLLNSVDGSDVTDATVSIEEDESSAFEGAVPNSIVGENRENEGKEGKYTFKRVHPINTGSFFVVAKRAGFKDESSEVMVNLNEFLTTNPSSLSLGCNGGKVLVENLLNAQINGNAHSNCLEITGININPPRGGANIQFSLPAKEKLELNLMPSIINKDCNLYVQAMAGTTPANVTVPIQIACASLDRGCTEVTDCKANEICRENICRPAKSCTKETEAADCLFNEICKDNLCVPRSSITQLPPDKIEIVLDENHFKSMKFTIDGVKPDVKLKNCRIRSTDTGKWDIEKFIDKDCQINGQVITLTADYANHPYYANKDPTNVVFETDEQVILQEGTLYVDFTDESQLSPKLIVKDKPIDMPPVNPDEPVDPSTYCDKTGVTGVSENLEDDIIRVTYGENNYADYINNSNSTLIANCIANATSRTDQCRILEDSYTWEINICPEIPGPGPLPDNMTTILITRDGFIPPEISIDVDTPIRWVNQDTKSHTVTSISNAFKSGSIAAGKNFTYKFTKAGVYNYRDTAVLSSKGVVYVGPLDGMCRYKNANYFVQRMIGYLAKSTTRFIEPNSGKSQDIAYSSFYKFFVQPNGVRAVRTGGLQDPSQRWDPFAPYTDPSQAIYQQYGANILSGAEDPLLCTESGSTFDCHVTINPLFPSNGVAFTIVNDMALITGSPYEMLVDPNSGNSKYLSGIYVDKQGIDGFIVGGLQEMNNFFLSAPRYSTFILANDPALMEYKLIDGKVALRFKDEPATKVTQTFVTKSTGGQAQITVKITFEIDDSINDFSVMKVPTSDEIPARIPNDKAKEPYFLINNIPESDITNPTMQSGRGDFYKIKYIEAELSNSTKTPLDIKIDNFAKSEQDAISFELPQVKSTVSTINYDVIGNVIKEPSLLPLGCSGNDFCTYDKYQAVDGATKKKLSDAMKNIKLQRLDFASFGDVAKRRFVEAIKLTLRDFVQDQAQYQICKKLGWSIEDFCNGKAAGSSDYDCQDDTHCDNNINFGEVFDVFKEQFGYSLCSSEFINGYEALAQARNYDGMGNLLYSAMNKNPKFQPRVQYTKPIIDVTDLKVAVIHKRAADGKDNQGYILKEYIDLIPSAQKNTGLISMNKWFSKSAPERAAIAAKRNVPEDDAVKSLKSGSFQVLRPYGSEDKPQYYYLNLTDKQTIEADGKGTPNLFTMNKYPFDFKENDKLKLFEALKTDKELAKSMLEKQTGDKYSTVVESCKIDFNRILGADLVTTGIIPTTEGITEGACEPNLVLKIKQKMTDEKIDKPFAYMELKDGKLQIVSASFVKPCTYDEMAKCKPYTTYTVFDDISMATLNKALAQLIDEKVANEKVKVNDQIEISILANLTIKQEKNAWSFGFLDSYGQFINQQVVTP